MDKWRSFSNRKKITLIAVTLLVVAVLFWNPMTRQAIVFLLPLGSGVDDLIFAVCLVIGLVLLAIRIIAGKKMD